VRVPTAQAQAMPAPGPPVLVRPAPEPTPVPVIPSEPPERKGGHGLRNAVIVVGAAAAAGGTALALRSGGEQSGPPATTGTGLPASGIAGTYVGTETIAYSGSCSGTDDLVLNLQQSASSLSGVLSFTVRACPCCAAGRGANPVSGFVSGTRVDLTTPVGFVYSGSFAGNLLSGSLTGPGGITGTWSVEKR
jgi:hypothetical protein